jgi:hypothetical protein
LPAETADPLQTKETLAWLAGGASGIGLLVGGLLGFVSILLYTTSKDGGPTRTDYYCDTNSSFPYRYENSTIYNCGSFPYYDTTCTGTAYYCAQNANATNVTQAFPNVTQVWSPAELADQLHTAAIMGYVASGFLALGMPLSIASCVLFGQLRSQAARAECANQT